MRDLTSWAKAKPNAIDKLLAAMAVRKPKAAKDVKPNFDAFAARLKTRETLGDAVLKNWKDEN